MNDNPHIKAVSPTSGAVTTPCIGVCSASSLGDIVCRGCLRYDFEVDHWHHYSELEKQAVLNRIQQLAQLILQDKIIIVSVSRLSQHVFSRYPKLKAQSYSPYSLLFEWVRRNSIEPLLISGAIKVKPDYAHIKALELTSVLKKDMQYLCKAHYERYIKRYPR